MHPCARASASSRPGVQTARPWTRMCSPLAKDLSESVSALDRAIQVLKAQAFNRKQASSLAQAPAGARRCVGRRGAVALRGNVCE
eukprot:62056-Pyramimonas_sp.AAC.1